MDNTHDFGDGKGPVPARRHINPDSSDGGWVAAEAGVDAISHIGEQAEIFGRASIIGSRVVGKVKISGSAELRRSRILNIFGQELSIAGDINLMGVGIGGNGSKMLGNERVTLSSNKQICYGKIGDFQWTAFATKDGIWLQFGCQEYRMEWWEQHLEYILKEEPREREPYREQLKALFALVRLSVKY